MWFILKIVLFTYHLIEVFVNSKLIIVKLVLVLLVFSKIALVIIENGARWLVENFVLSRYNHR